MKRLNPETGKPFVRGDTRADGFLFRHYRINKVKQNGFFEEQWYSPKAFKKLADGNKKLHAKRQLFTDKRAITLIGSARTRCRKRGRGVVTITKDWINQKLVNGVCELTGLPFDFSPELKAFSNPYSPSLDRIDNSNPDYTPENTRVVLTVVNRALSEFGINVLLPVMKALIDKQSIC